MHDEVSFLNGVSCTVKTLAAFLKQVNLWWFTSSLPHAHAFLMI